MLTKKSWNEFREVGLLWFVNRILHLFGWAICVDYDDVDRMAAAIIKLSSDQNFREKSGPLNRQKAMLISI